MKVRGGNIIEEVELTGVLAMEALPRNLHALKFKPRKNWTKREGKGLRTRIEFNQMKISQIRSKYGRERTQ